MFGNQRHHRRPGRRGNGAVRGLRRWLPSRRTLLKLGVVSMAAVGTVWVLQVGGPPFPYRVGQTYQRDIRAKVKFERVNRARTELRQAQAAGAVPPIYRHHPQPLEQLQEETQNLAQALASTEQPDQLPSALTTAWQLQPADCRTLHSSVDSPEKLKKFLAVVDELFRSLRAHGVLNVEAEPQGRFQGSNRRIQVQGPDGRRVPWNVHAVARDALLKPGGPIFEKLASEIKPAAAARTWATLIAQRLSKLPDTLVYDQVATAQARREARDSVPLEKDPYNPGDLLVPQGQAITQEQLELLRTEHEQVAAQRGTGERLQRTAGLTALVLALFALAGYYVSCFERRLADSPAQLALIGLLLIVALGVAKLSGPRLVHSEAIPVALTAMSLAIAYSQQFALLITFCLGLACSWMFGSGLDDFVVLTGGTAAAVVMLNRVRSRTKLVLVGLTGGVTYFALTWATGSLTSQSQSLLLWDSSALLLWGVLSGFIMGGCLPFLEKIFGIVTDMRLLELCDVNNALLQALVREAPGTYNHSVTVATLAEAAAEAIGANALLARVGSYFHDIGKMLKPHYFVENQTDSVNRHQSLHPTMSTLIIIGHVKDGIELAREHHLPEPIIDFIPQHHGTTLVEYFFREASREAAQGGSKEVEIDEAAFRYPGPKPQTREACAIMLADAVEGASRALSEPVPARIRRVVDEITRKRLEDGQFDECGITMQEIAAMKESLVKSLNSIYHGRVKYPEQQIA